MTEMTEIIEKPTHTKQHGKLYDSFASESDPNKVDSTHTYYILIGRYSRKGLCLKFPMKKDTSKNELIEKLSENIFKPNLEGRNIVIPYKVFYKIEITSGADDQMASEEKTEEAREMCIIRYCLVIPRELIIQLKANGIEKAYFYVGLDEIKTGQLPFAVIAEEPPDNMVAKHTPDGEPAPYKTAKLYMNELLLIE